MNPLILSSSLKRKTSRLISLALIISLILLAAPNPASADTSICGVVSGTWMPAGNNYVVTCDIQIIGGTSLTIQPGVVVKFNNGTSLRIDGELVANGVTFTSVNTSPGKGNWGHIYFTATSMDAVFDGSGNYISGSKILGSTVDWGGGGSGVNGEVEIAGASPLLDNNTIRNSSRWGIYAVGRASDHKIVVIKNTVSTNNGGGVYIATGELKENTISGNHSDAQGGGVYATNSILESNQITQNDTDDPGAGIYSTGCTINNNTVSGNTNDKEGAGIYAIGGALTNNTITGNRTDAQHAFGGGVYASGSILTGNTISGNVANYNYPSQYGGSARGGGIYASLSTLSGNIVLNNTASSAATSIAAYGGGIYAVGGTVSGNTVSGNTATASGATSNGLGGGIYADGGSVSNNNVNNNTVGGTNDGQGGGIYGSLNTISNNSLSGNSANRGGAIYSSKGTVTHNTITNNITAFTGNVFMNEGTALENNLQGNTAVNAGGIYGNQATITGNTIQNNTANLGGGIISTDSTVRGNKVSGNTAQSDGGGIFAQGGTVTYNSFTNNTAPSWGRGSGAYIENVTDFRYNDVTGNTAPGGTVGGVSIISGNPVFQYNNLHGNLPYDAEVVSVADVGGTLNYWGESACIDIPKLIYDGNDMPGRGKLTYAPSLYQAYPLAQLSAPANLTGVKNGSSVVLSWDAIPPIPDIGCRLPGSQMRYRIYYDTDVSCAPYNGTGLSQGPSPIDVGQNTSATLSSLTASNYFFVVTAYENYLGPELQSSFSNEINIISDIKKVYLPMVTR